MASIKQRNKSYAVIYYFKNEEGESKQRWETYHSLESAVKRKNEIENPIEFLEPAPHINTFEELLREYIRLHGKLNWSFSMYTNNMSLMKRYIIPFIGGAKLVQIDTYLMSRFYEKLHKTPPSENKYKPKQKKMLTPNTIFEIHQLLRSVFNQAVIWGYFPDSPVRHIRLKKPRHPIDILTPEQVMTVLNKASSSDPLLFLGIQVAFMTSMRKGEIMALKWDDINFDDCSIYVNKELTRVSLEALNSLENKGVYHTFPPQVTNAKSRLILKVPKTDSSVRTIYIPKFLINNLLQWRNKQNDDKKIYGHKYKDYGLIFAQKNGLPSEGKELSENFFKLLKECDLPRVVFHSLRHSSTTYKLILSGGNIKAVQGDTGHAQPNMVLSVYARILDGERKKLADMMETEFCAHLQTNN